MLPRWRLRWGSWLAARLQPAAPPPGPDGGTCGRWRWTARRCAAPGMPVVMGQARHLLAAADQQAGAVLAQAEVDGKTNEISAFAPLLAPLDLAGAVVTADALHAQREHAQFLVTQKGAHCILAVKNNSPPCALSSRTCPGGRSQPASTRRTGHGRAERRTLKSPPSRAGLAFPHAALAIQSSGAAAAAERDKSGPPRPVTPSPAWPPARPPPADARDATRTLATLRLIPP